ncbi:MAG: hypothetical protein LBH35_00650 [Treponema sp.]|jgi:hypothetical protein|nr:hypothetical protein [Treponema sp.]
MKNLVVVCVAAVILLGIGIFCYTKLEIVPATRWKDPSREARENPRLALERWISGRGIPVRTLFDGTVETILEGPEKTIFIMSSCFDWDDAEEGYRLNSWAKAGGRLVISIDTYTAGWQLSEYLITLGVEEYESDYESAGEPAEDEYAEDELSGNELSESESSEGSSSEDEAPEDESLIVDFDNIPSLDDRIEFVITGKSEDVDKISIIPSYTGYSDDARYLNDRALLVHLEMGAGSITITGEAYFLNNWPLRSESNAHLAGALFVETPPENGVLFIRKGRNEKHLFGSLAEKGNTTALLVSAIALIITGFWMVIPLFGRTRPVPALPGKPLRERFLAEGRFLYAYNGLDRYLSAYEAELERRRGIRGVTAKEKPETKAAGKKLPLRHFVKRQNDYMEELEKLAGSAALREAEGGVLDGPVSPPGKTPIP